MNLPSDSPRIRHYFCDDTFINSHYTVFEELFPGCNEYCLLGCPDKRPKHVKFIESCVFVDNLKDSFSSLINDNRQIAIFYSMPDKWLSVLKHIPNKVKVVWRLFGFEIYSDSALYARNSLYDKITLSIIEKERNKKTLLKEKIKSLVYFKAINSKCHKQQKQNACKRVDFLYFGTEEEFFEINRVLNHKSLQFARTWENSLETYNKRLLVNTAKNVTLIGHSSSPAGNHLDIFARLQQLGVCGQSVYVPVSYGDNNRYVQRLKEADFVRENEVVFWEEFLPADEYFKMQNAIKVAVFNTRRQMAGFNIINLLYLGAKLFVSEKNSFYWWAKRNGFTIYSYEKELDRYKFMEGLTMDEIEKNRKIMTSLVHQYYSENKTEILKFIVHERRINCG